MSENEEERAETRVSKIKNHFRRNARRYAVVTGLVITKVIVIGIAYPKYRAFVKKLEFDRFCAEEDRAEREWAMEYYRDYEQEFYVGDGTNALVDENSEPLDFDEWLEDWHGPHPDIDWRTDDDD